MTYNPIYQPYINGGYRSTPASARNAGLPSGSFNLGTFAPPSTTQMIKPSTNTGGAPGAAPAPAPTATATTSPQPAFDYSSDPLLQSIRSGLSSTSNRYTSNYNDSVNQMLLAFGSKDLATKVLGAGNPLLSSFDTQNPYSTIGYIGHTFDQQTSDAQLQQQMLDALLGAEQSSNASIDAAQNASTNADIRSIGLRYGAQIGNERDNLAQYNFQQPIDTKASNEDYNQQNLWYSTARDTGLSQLAQQYAMKRETSNRHIGEYGQMQDADIAGARASAAAGAASRAASLQQDMVRNQFQHQMLTSQLSDLGYQRGYSLNQASNNVLSGLSGMQGSYLDRLAGLDQQGQDAETQAYMRAVAAVQANPPSGSTQFTATAPSAPGSNPVTIDPVAAAALGRFYTGKNVAA